MKVPYFVTLLTFLFGMNYVHAQFAPQQKYWEQPRMEDWINPLRFMQADEMAGSASEEAVVPCDCTVTQGGFSVNISSMLGTQLAEPFYNYNANGISSANTGLELSNTARLFLYEDPNGGISFFLIMDDDDGSGGNASYEFECMPDGTFVDFVDDPGSSGTPDNVSGSPPTFTADFSWGPQNTDGVVFGGLGCGFAFDIYPGNLGGIGEITWVTGDLNNPMFITFPSLTERIRVNCGGPACCPDSFESTIFSQNAGCPNSSDGQITVTPTKGTPPFTFIWDNGDFGGTITDLPPGEYTVTITDAEGCMDEETIIIDNMFEIPEGTPITLEACGDATNVGVFNLAAAAPQVGGGMVTWYEDIDLFFPIPNIGAYATPATTVYAVVSNGFCESEPVPVTLEVLFPPAAEPFQSLSECDLGTGEAIFNLNELIDPILNGQTGTVNFFEDQGGNFPINNPNPYISSDAMLWAVVVDENGCESEPVSFELFVIEAPDANVTSVELCDEGGGQATFNLTDLEDDVNNDPNVNINWYIDPGASILINDPSNFTAGTISVYVVVDDGECESQPTEIMLTVNEIPSATDQAIVVCGDETASFTFDLTEYEDGINDGGALAVSWFEDMAGNNAILTPDNYTTGSTSVFAILDNGFCVSEPVEFELTINPTPVAVSDTITVCADMGDEATFDLTMFESTVNDGTGEQVVWYEDSMQMNQIVNTTMYTTMTDTIFAIVDNGDCQSEVVPFLLNVEGLPVATAVSAEQCEEANDESTFNLTDLDNGVANGSGAVVWYEDANLTQPIADPANYLTGTTTVYAVVDNGGCTSFPAEVDLTVFDLPEPNVASQELCETNNDQATFDLTLLENTVNGGSGTVQWYTDANASMAINNPGAYVSGTATIYATVDNGQCVSEPVEVDLTVNLLPETNPADIAVCDEGSSTATFDLTTLEDEVSGGVGTVTWYDDANQNTPIVDPSAFVSGDNIIFAFVDDGTCESEAQAVTVSILSTPVANITSESLCEEANSEATFDLTTLEADIYTGPGGVNWYLDDQGMNPIADPANYLTGTTTIFAQVDNGACTSTIEPIELTVLELPETSPASQSLCEEMNDQATFDLLTLANTVSTGAGGVTWFTDAAATSPLGLTSVYPTTSTTIYAVVDNGNCVSAPVAVDLEVMLLPTANPYTIEDCDDGNGGASLTLNDYALEVNPDGEEVLWFEDAALTTPIDGGTGYFTGPTTLYAVADDQMCQSPAVAVDVDITVAMAPDVECIFTSIDSVNFAWDPIGLEYEITYNINNGGDIGPVMIADTSFGVGNLVEGDIVEITVGVIVDPDCPPVQFTTTSCEADNCPINPIEFNNLADTYCNNEPPFVVDVTPLGGTLTIDGVTNNTFDASNYVDTVMLFYTYIDPMTTCEYVDSFTIVVEEALQQPMLECVDPTTQTLTFNWTDVGADEYQLVYTVNGGDPDTLITDELTYTLGGLSDENDVVFEVTPLGDAPCGNGPSVTTNCSTLPCPPPSLAIDFLDPSYCSDGPLVDLPDLYPNGTYSGPGVAGLTFDPTMVGANMATIAFEYTDTMTGCSYIIEGMTEIIEPLEPPMVSCTDMTEVSVTFTWDATSDIGEYTYTYTVNGMNPVSGNIMDNTLTVTGIFPEDVVDITVVALGSQPCGESEAASGSCSALPCPNVPITISGLDAEYCEDGMGSTLTATPVGGTFSGSGVTGDQFDPAAAGVGTHTIYYNYTDPVTLCDYVDSVMTEVFEPLALPEITCEEATTQSVTFSWLDVNGGGSYEVTYSINGQPAVTQTLVVNMLTLPNLNPEDEVDITVVAIGPPPCGNSEAATQTCSALPCPIVTFDLNSPALICETDDAFALDLEINNQSTMANVVWSGDAVSPDGIFDPAQANIGTNTITVSLSEIGCDYDSTFTLEVLPTPVAAFTAGSLICSDSTLTVTYEGTATADANIIWDYDGGMVVSGQPDGTFELMWDTPGTYTISLQIDDEGCVSEIITQEVEVVGPLVPTTIICESIDLTSILFSWDPVANANEYVVTSSTGTGTLNGTTFLVENLEPGQQVDIEVTSIGDTPCGPVVATGSCTTDECPDVNIVLNTTPVICEGEDGQVEVQITGGPANESYTLEYLLNGSTETAIVEANDVLTFPNLQAGIDFEVVQFFGNSFAVCTYGNAESVSIQVNTPPVAGQALNAFEQCEGVNEQVTLADLLTNADAGGNWSFAQGNLPGFDAATGTVNTPNLDAGQYDFVYTVSGNGICPDDTETVSVVINPNPVADAGIDAALDCVTPTTSLQSGTTGVTYAWESSTPDGIIGNTNGASIQVGAAGTYSLTVTNEFGCEDVDEAQVTESFDEPIPVFSVEDISCFGAEDGVIIVDSITGGVPPYEFSLNGQNTSSLVNLAAGEYTIEVTGANGCSTTEDVVLVEPEELIVDIEADIEATNNLITFGDSVLLEAFYQPTDRILDTIVWSPDIAGGLDVFVRPELQTTYTVTVIDENGCLAMDEITLFVEKKRPVFIPNIFSPNEDGTNDIFYIQGGEQIANIKTFYVFSRWGEAMFEAFNFQPNDPGFGWNGTHRGREVNTGVYVFLAEIEFNDGETILYKGDVTLMR